MPLEADTLFETNFKKEVYSDLTGERGTLMGAIQGIFAAQYQVLRDKGHTPSEAFNETVEELTQSLMPLVAENGMDWMYANCSTTAQRGALDWWKKFRDATAPVFKELYESVATGKESQRSIDSNSKADYREKLEVELKELRDSEMWQAGKTVRSLRPENQAAPASKIRKEAGRKSIIMETSTSTACCPWMYEGAAERLKKVVIRTPLILNHNLSRKYQCNVYLKREDLQVVRSYKIRGAYNMMSRFLLKNSEKRCGMRECRKSRTGICLFLQKTKCEGRRIHAHHYSETKSGSDADVRRKFCGDQTHRRYI